MYVTEMYDNPKSGINNYVPVFGYYFRQKFTRGNLWRLDVTKTIKEEKIEYKQITVAD